MLKHNLKLFLRNIKNNLGAFLINTVGLGVGIASFLLLALYVYNDLTYNHFHKNFSKIYRVRDGNEVQTKGPVLPKMLADVPEIENGTRIFDWEELRIGYKDVAFPENIKYVDSGFFSVFTFPFIEGSAQNAIENKYGAVVSEQFAQKYFGNEPAMGKKLQIKFEDIFLEVTGVVAIPANSSIKFDIVTSYETGEEISPWIKEVHDWYNMFSITYVLLRDGVEPDDIDEKLQRIVTENYLPVGQNQTDLNLLPFKEYHATEESNQTLLIILAIVALGTIAIAIINFINLTIINVMSRAKEIGIKKVHGATRNVLFRQILTESFLVTFMALVLGITLMLGFLPTFNQLFETNLRFEPFQNKIFLAVLISMGGIVGFLAGLIPSLFWAKGKIMESLKGNVFSGKRTSARRYSLIVAQFGIAIILISGTLLIRKQINAMLEKDPKFDNENVIVVQLQSWQFPDPEITSKNYKLIAEELEESPYVESVSFSGNVPGTYSENYNSFYPQDESQIENINLRKAYVGANYFKTFGIDLLSGHGFEQGSISHENTIVLNKAAMNKLGFQEARGQILNESSKTGEPYKVVGMVDDFSYQGVQREVQPLAHIFSTQEDYTNWGYISVRAKKGSSLHLIELLRSKWIQTFPGIEPDYFFANSKLNEQYRHYIKVNAVIAWFSILAIILSCMGLFALARFIMARRTKEIGIRKVNGATTTQILSLLNKDFVKWVGLAFVIAVPISWYALNKWLEGFAYKTEISWWIFAFAGISALTIALLTVSWQSFKAATANPAHTLRNE